MADFNNVGTRTLCWSCSKACGGCSWSKVNGKPVKGWVATETFVNDNHWAGNDGYQSFIVHECPEYERDARCPKYIPCIGHCQVCMRRMEKHEKV